MDKFNAFGNYIFYEFNVIHYSWNIWSGLLSFKLQAADRIVCYLNVFGWLVSEEFTDQRLCDYFFFSEFWRFASKKICAKKGLKMTEIFP